MNPARTISIGVLAYPGCLPSSATIPLDVLRIANAIAALRPSSLRVRFEGRLVSARGARPITAGGLSFNPASLARTDTDALIVPSIDHRGAADIATVLATLEREREALIEYAAGGRLLASACSGACVAASAGLLDGRRCTTSWWLAPWFLQRFPMALLDAEHMLVRDGGLLSSGGVSSSLDLALWLVGHFGGEELRQLSARMLATDPNRTSQSPFVASAMVEGEGETVERARDWIRQRIGRPWSVAQLARHCGVTPRTLLRRFQEALRLTPSGYAQQLRVERARELLETTSLAVGEVARRAGYDTQAAFSRTFKRWTQATPAEYRRRFGLRH
ncbi:MAG TPA: helix-turn-helix domain-containing protein [Telluria sp.]|nr:helix-turn-helix domain-containing protein [Telluria sp.]